MKENFCQLYFGPPFELYQKKEKINIFDSYGEIYLALDWNGPIVSHGVV